MCEHAVQFYENDDFLINEVSGRVRQILSEGGASVVIATPEHRRQLADSLGAGLLTEAGSRYLAMDARETLSSFMIDGIMDADMFRCQVTGLLDAISDDVMVPIFAYGEMVALLVADGRVEDAICLEQMWNGLLAQRPGVTLLCAYPLRLFGYEALATDFRRICQAHHEVRPTEMFLSMRGPQEVQQQFVLWQQQALAMAESEVARVSSAACFHSNEAILVFDRAGVIIWANPALALLTGYSIDELQGSRPEEKLALYAVQPANGELCVLQGEGLAWQGEVTGLGRDGRKFAAYARRLVLHAPVGDFHRGVLMMVDVSRRKQDEALIWRQANFDQLTGLPNRNLFVDRLNQEIRVENRVDRAFALLLLDLDRFQDFNDIYGPALGDQLLREAAHRLQGCIRDVDTVARLGGDEFGILLASLEHHTHIEGVVQRILSRLREPFFITEEPVYLSASIGVAMYPADATSGDELLKNADQAMYAAKSRGRNGFCYFTRIMQTEAETHLHLLNDLRMALPSGQLAVWFQPIIEVASGRICKAEALLRWQHPIRGMIPPVEFVPLAEESGLIQGIGDWVFREAVFWALRWKGLTEASFQISVNRSPTQFLAAGEEEWPAYMLSKSAPAACIAVEITEQLLLHLTPRVVERLDVLRRGGLQISIDDFGTGYSSMSYLQRLAVDFIKIDQSFIADMVSSAASHAIVEAIIAMAHKLGVKVIAEGVETEEQYNCLKSMGCDYVQGYLFSRPIPPEEFEERLLSGGFASNPQTKSQDRLSAAHVDK